MKPRLFPDLAEPEKFDSYGDPGMELGRSTMDALWDLVVILFYLVSYPVRLLIWWADKGTD